MKAVVDKEKDFGRVDVHDVTSQFGVFAIAGPNSRDILAEIIKDEDAE